MKVLALCSFPRESAATRYRLMQYIDPLAEKEIELTVLPYFGTKEYAILYKSGYTMKKGFQIAYLTGKRILDSLKAHKFDVLLVQREAMIFGPPIFEWLSKTIGKCPLILDLDDATYIPYVSPTFGKLGTALKFFGKTNQMIDWSETVICGNRFIAKHVEGRGKKTTIVPTVVDTDRFCPVEKDENKIPIIGWIGTHTTFPFLEAIFPVLSDLAQKYEFVLKVIGSGQEEIKIDGVNVENLTWSLTREIEDFQSMDIGLYPMKVSESVSKEWIQGKSGFKAIQYMSVGIPFTVTPLGVTSEMGIKNKTHFTATNNEEWYGSLEKLLKSKDLRKKMGKEGRKYALDNYTVSQQVEKIADTLRNAVNNK